MGAENNWVEDRSVATKDTGALLVGALLMLIGVRARFLTAIVVFLCLPTLSPALGQGDQLSENILYILVF